MVNTGSNQTEIILVKDALKVLKSETRDVTLTVITGPTGKGKSYLMICLMTYSNGIKSNTANPKGFWIWIGIYPNDPSRCLILLDIEGFLDFEKEISTLDLKLFSFALFSSSMFIYNTPGLSGSSDMNYLNLLKIIVNQITKDFMESELRTCNPHFVLSIHDHSCAPEKCNKDINNSIHNPEKRRKDIEKKLKNNFMESIGILFPSRDFFIFPNHANDVNIVLYAEKFVNLVFKKMKNKFSN